MKLLTIAIPSYNSEDYLQNALDSLVASIEDLDVIIVNDGSKDRTLEIAEAFREKYPDSVRVVDKENGGHGSGVMTGIREGQGIFYYVLDSDDWLDEAALKQVIKRLEAEEQRRLQGEAPLDLLVCNYVYCKVDEPKKPVQYRKSVPVGRRFDWQELKRFPIATFFTMHSLIYRMDVLRESGVELPDHTFYVDNLIAYVPLPFVKTMYYEDIDLYQYFIGRDEQSVNRDVLIKRIDQQIKVTKLLAASYHVYDDIPDKKLQEYLLSYLSILVTITIAHLHMSKNPDDEPKIEEFWMWLKNYDKKMYKYCRHDKLNMIMNLVGDWDWGKKTITTVYDVAQKIFRFS